jgi:hypothetical protein
LSGWYDSKVMESRTGIWGKHNGKNVLQGRSALGRNSFISCDTVELMPIAALMSIDVSNSLGRHSQSREAPRSRASKLMQGLNTLAIIVLARIKCGSNIKTRDRVM